MSKLTIPTPDDFHIHLRDGAALARTVADAASQCARALVMPNLTPALDSVAAVEGYRERIIAHIPEGTTFTPLMSLYLSDGLTPQTVIEAKAAGVVAVKWYPRGATTNSAQGVAEVSAIYPLLEALEAEDMLLLIHGEVTDPEIDIFDREARFIDEVLCDLRVRFPRLRMVLEHITTKRGVEFVRSQAKNTAATITPQHLLFNRNALLVGGIKPHYYCLPILKTEADRAALVEAATSGDPRFFLGTDSAPHAQSAKENACGCAGCYSAHASLALYAAVFDQAGALDKLGNFAARFGADFYRLPYNPGTVTLERVEQRFPETLPYGDTTIVPFLAGERWPWRLLA
ncbi:dihydroorotase [Suttonella sp. R2A3]|uniref:dihydroorotase n=1 Tax=Suttonella sp. R2A3 TaxID=2908648 RepID=UPI001F3D5494|nr:dihydroorotase [Suttonella sp. R2A3]UJF24946.1 dihydroorotase [Suttonella sp. R2A3]